jgi:hypothetical protein
LVTVNGNNFGFTSNLTIYQPTGTKRGGFAWPIISQTHTQIIFAMPSGQGNGVDILIRVPTTQLDGTVSGVNALLNDSLSYDIPMITSIIPSAVPSSLNTITIVGSNFGDSSTGDAAIDDVALPSMSITAVCNELTRNHTYITCIMAQSDGGPTHNLRIRSPLGAAFNTFVGLFGFSSAAPQITRISGCGTSTATETLDCLTGGGQRISIDGVNFGKFVISSGSGTLNVTIGGRECVDVFLIAAQTQLNCTVPAGFGRNVPVIVSRGFGPSSRLYSDPQPYLSYRSPLLKVNTLRLAELGSMTQFILVNGSNVAWLQGASGLGGDRIRMIGQYLGTNQSAIMASFGPPGEPLLYPCANVTIVSVISSETTFECTTTRGVGTRLGFQVNVLGLTSPQGTDFYAFPAPILFNNTLRIAGRPKPVAIAGSPTVLQSNTTEGSLSSLFPFPCISG